MLEYQYGEAFFAPDGSLGEESVQTASSNSASCRHRGLLAHTLGMRLEDVPK